MQLLNSTLCVQDNVYHFDERVPNPIIILDFLLQEEAISLVTKKEMQDLESDERVSDPSKRNKNSSLFTIENLINRSAGSSSKTD